MKIKIVVFTLNLQIEEPTELGNGADLALVEAGVRVEDIPINELM
jgi:hypothetical protein